MESIYDDIKPQQSGFALNSVPSVSVKGKIIKRHYWTAEEGEYLRTEYKYTRESFGRLTREFGVSDDALRKVLGRLGLVKYEKLWTRKEEKYLRENYDKLPTVTISRVLKRSGGAVSYKAHKLKLSKFERSGWFTFTEVRRIFGVSRNWLIRRINNGFTFDMQPFDSERVPAQGNNSPWYIPEESVRDFIRRYPEELVGHNVDFVMLVEILAGIKTDIRREICDGDAEEEHEDKEAV